MPRHAPFDVVSTLDGLASFDGREWGPFWGRGRELLDHRLAAYSEQQRLVLGANAGGPLVASQRSRFGR